MGLISGSSLGQPIIRINDNIINSKKITDSNVSNKNKLVTSCIMAPALTTESSAEHRKRSLTDDVKNCSPKLDSESCSGRQSRPGGPNNTLADNEHNEQDSKDDGSAERAFLQEAEDVDVDDILKVLESMEGGKGASVAGEDSMLRLLGSDLELLPDMDCTDHSQETEPETRPDSPTPKVQDRLAEASSRQHVLERRCDRLLRRARKLQARGTAKHSAYQMQELVTCARALLKARNSSHRSHAAQQSSKEQLLDSEQVKNMSAAALVNLVRQISSVSQQGLAQALSPDQAATLRDGAGSLQFRLRHVESTLDSDVTASSSGGESCDESAGYNPNHTGTTPIYKRAAWRFARERASVVGRWTWLQANISDLEYRIRQYSECHRQLRVNKGPVRLEHPSKADALGEDQQQQQQQLVINGFHAESTTEAGSSEAADGETACRTRPLDLKSFRKRKLVVPGVLLPKSGRRCFPSHNQPPCCRDSFSMPCVLCFSKRTATVTGAVAPREVGAREGCRERAARLDPAIHPVLSGYNDVSRCLHMAAQLRQPGWQQMQLRQRGLTRLGLGLKRTKAAVEGATSATTPRRKYTHHKKNNNTATAISAKIRRKAKTRKRHRGRPVTDPSTESLDRYKRNRRVQRNSMASSEGAVDYDDVAPSPSQSGERQARRKRESSYDIDNIVIPYSMAALTRVEKLEYKEIPTPKWRVSEILPLSRKYIGCKNGVVKGRMTNLEMEEDVSEEKIGMRHDPLEMEERRKFRCPPSSSRSLRARRTDSRAGSSGANTPDPMSPNPAGLEVGDSPLASPRATPPTVMNDEASTSGKEKIKPGRRRATYQRPSSPDLPPPEVVAPFEPRVFPLSDEETRQLLLTRDFFSSPFPPDSNKRIGNQQGLYNSKSPWRGGRSYVASSTSPRTSTLTAPPSPCGTDSTESAVPEEDEDPEWTLDCEPPEDEDIPITSRTPRK